MFENLGEMLVLFWRALLAMPSAWRQREKVFEQFFEIGNASLLMVSILSFFVGGVIALQTAPTLVEKGLASAVGGVVGLAICRELELGSIAFPAISTGIYGYPIPLAADVSVRAIRDDVRVREGAPPLVKVVLFDDRAFEAFVAASDRLLT